MPRDLEVSGLAMIALTNVCETKPMREQILARAREIARRNGDLTVYWHHMELAFDELHMQSLSRRVVTLEQLEAVATH